MSGDVVERPGGASPPEGFLELPPLVYAADPLWIPEDPAAVERAFGPGNAWFAQARARTFCVPGEARVAAFHDPRVTIDGRAAAFFGYWETRGEPGPDRELFRAAESWARARGARDLYGPIDFTTYGKYRLRVQAEEGALPFPGEPYNPPGYPALLESLGFAGLQTYVSQILTVEGVREACESKRAARERVLERGYRLETLGPDVWLESLPQLYELIDVIFGGNFAYAPIPYESFAQSFGASFIRRACPRSSILARAPGGDVVGLFLAVPHYGPLVVQGAGAQRLRVSELSYAEHFPLLAGTGPVTVLAKTLGVDPAHRRQGLMDAMTVELIERGRELYSRWCGALIRSDNPSQRFGAGHSALERRYVLYRKQLA